MEHDYLIRMIKERENDLNEVEVKLAPLVSQAKGLKVEINVLKEALKKAETTLAKPKSNVKERALQPHWNNTLLFIGRNGKASLNQIHEYINSTQGKELSEDTVRSQLSTYVSKEWLGRISDGVYTLTESGAIKCNYSEKNEAPTRGASKVDDVDASSNSNAGFSDQTEKVNIDDFW